MNFIYSVNCDGLDIVDSENDTVVDEDDFYLTEPEEDMTGDPLDGGEVCYEPDYVIN